MSFLVLASKSATILLSLKECFNLGCVNCVISHLQSEIKDRRLVGGVVVVSQEIITCESELILRL